MTSHSLLTPCEAGVGSGLASLPPLELGLQGRGLGMALPSSPVSPRSLGLVMELAPPHPLLPFLLCFQLLPCFVHDLEKTN